MWKRFDDKNFYAVSGICNPISEKMDISYLPNFIETTLLPFKDRIIYDSFISSFRIAIGSGMRTIYEQKKIKF